MGTRGPVLLVKFDAEFREQPSQKQQTAMTRQVEIAADLSKRILIASIAVLHNGVQVFNLSVAHH